MAGPGGGPPRRSHTKSRKGCDMCKKRHIRCDENFPQCRNCTKHKIRCPYNDVSAADGTRSATPDKPDLMWTPEIEDAIVNWQRTGVFPFPSLNIVPEPNPLEWKREELRLIYHVASLYHELALMDATNFTMWTRHIPTLLRIGATTPYVMHALIAFSAMHIAYLTDCPGAGSMAVEHHGIALIGLHKAIGAFSPETSDAILAASLVLSWQATDWPSWTQHMHGTAAVMDAMTDWKHESQFGDFIQESSTFPTAPPSPGPDHRASELQHADLLAFQRTVEQISKVESHLKHEGEATNHMQALLSFLKGSRKLSPTLNMSQQFERLRSLREWLFWHPVDYLQKYRCSPNSMVAIAHLYSVALLMERMFPNIGSAYFGSLTLVPIEEIARRLMYICKADGAMPSYNASLKLMEFPIDAVGDFRSRMGWLEPERTNSFPQYHPPNFPALDSFHDPVQQYASPNPYTLCGNPAFSYSAEDISVPNTGAPADSPVATLAISSPYTSHTHLNIPPSGYGGAYSPASSHFEGSVTWSDADEYSTFDMSGNMPSASGQHSHSRSSSQQFYGELRLNIGYGLGFVSPTQPVWI